MGIVSSMVSQERTLFPIEVSVASKADNQTKTIHVDDLSRNFALNPGEGLKVYLILA